MTGATESAETPAPKAEQQDGAPPTVERDPSDIDWAAAASNRARDVNGIQARDVHGNVTINELSKPDVVFRREAVTDLQVGDDMFVERAGLDGARSMLERGDRVVVLSGAGTGRHTAAGRLLFERSIDVVVHLNPRWPLESIRRDHLEDGVGYVRMCQSDGGRAFDESDYTHLASLMASSGGYAILLVDSDLHVPHEIRSWLVRLEPPPFIEVATAIINARSDAPEEAITHVKVDFASRLPDPCPPIRALRAAELAISVVTNGMSIKDALSELQDDVSQSVSSWFGRRPRQRTVEEYAVLIAVAFFPERPYELVLQAAEKLEEVIRTLELKKGKEPRPPKVFGMSRHDLEELVGTRIELRSHPIYHDQFDEYIGFADTGRARAVIRHVWQEFPRLRDKLIDWLTHTWFSYDFFEDGAAALSYILATIPAHEPRARLIDLAADRRNSPRELAARTMSRLLVDERTKDVYWPLVEAWLRRKSSVAEKCTVAKLCGTPYGQRHAEWALTQLGSLAGVDSGSVKNAVISSVLDLLTKIGNRPLVLEALGEWTGPTSNDPRANRRRDTALRAAVWILGFVRLSDKMFATSLVFLPSRPLDDRERKIVGHLVRSLLREDEFAPGVVDALFHLARKTGGRRADEFDLIVRAIAPEFGVKSRHSLFTELVRRFPRMEPAIEVFREAVAEVQRQSTLR